MRREYDLEDILAEYSDPYAAVLPEDEEEIPASAPSPESGEDAVPVLTEAEEDEEPAEEDEVFPGYAFREGIIEGILQKIARQNKGLCISLNGTIVPESF